MFHHLSDLRDPLLAARFLREEILGQAVAPESARRLRERFLAANSPPGAGRAVELALDAARRSTSALVTRELLTELAEASGSPDVRSHSGAAFRSKPAPPPAGVPQLLGELLETINSPVAIESWPAPARAFGLHFLLRLVQPFQVPPDVVAFAAEVHVLAKDGFAADHLLLAEPAAGSPPGATKPDPDAFAKERMHRFVERLGESRDEVRDAAGRSLLAAWAERKEARLNPRQRRLVKWLAEREGAPHIEFQDYVDLHAGRRAPSVRSLQRDFQQLRERGLLRTAGESFLLDTRPLTFGG